MNKITDWLKALPQRLKAFWNRYTTKQKTLIILVLVGVICALALLSYVISRPHRVTLSQFDSTRQTAAARALLEEKQIDYKVSNDGLSIAVDENQIADARLILGENGVTSTDYYGFEDAFTSSFSETEAVKDKKYKLAVQSELAKTLTAYEGVRKAAVYITMPDQEITIFEENLEPTAAVQLETTGSLDSTSVQGMASFLATALGASNTDRVKITDQSGRLIFDGGKDTSMGAGGSLEYRNLITRQMSDSVKAILVKSRMYDDVEVMPNLIIDQDKVKSTNNRYYTEDGEKTGPLYHEESNESSGSGGSGGTPGTAANDGNSYSIENSGQGDSNSSSLEKDYNTSLEVTETEKGYGAVKLDESSIAIVMTKNIVYDEAQMKKNGQLNGITFDQFQMQNSNQTVLTVDPQVLTTISKATGIVEENIAVESYQIPMFMPIVKDSRAVGNYIQIGLAALIVALLFFVVFKGMKPVEVLEIEPELSVETLLATTKENQGLDDIEFSDKSATRQQIEKFVDENPEAVANLLRNWLNEDWG